MDKKIVYVLDTDENGIKISNGLHLGDIIKYVQTKQKNIKYISYKETFERTWNKNDFLFVVHSFKTWPAELWQSLLEKVQANISLVVTEFIPDVQILESHFKHSKINKIVICSESISKYFQKNLSIENSKIKYIPLLGEDIKEKTGYNPMSKTAFYPTIVIPGHLDEDKNFETILYSIYLLKLKYPTVLATFILKKNDNVTDDSTLDFLMDTIDSLDLNKNINLLTEYKQPYSKYLEYCDMVIIPSKAKNKLYYSTIVDAIKSLKPIVAPDIVYASDLCKKEAGILLYENELTSEEVAESISENCSIISDNKEIQNILSQQNAAVIQNFDELKVLPQFVNIIRKLKNSNDNAK